MKVLIGVQARSDSKRLPGKIYQAIGPKPLLKWVYDACYEAHRKLNAKNISSSAFVLGQEKDEELKKFCEANLLKSIFPKCDPNDLIKRYLEAAKERGCDQIVRITADCWQMNSDLIVEAVETLREFDYTSNTTMRSFMEGLVIQACSLKALEWFDRNQKESREHPFVEFDQNQLVRNDFTKAGLKYTCIMNPKAEWCMRTSIDTKDDLERANRIYEKINNRVDRILENEAKRSTGKENISPAAP
jgi:spore coat polysaccharide biosynthesis protein SpsF (cytidylyltransferase family)